MKKIYIIAIIVAVITGISVFNYSIYLEKKTKGESASVIVAVKRIPEYTVITSDMITEKVIGVEAVNGLGVRTRKDIEGKITNSVIEQDEQILKTRLKEKGADKGGLSYAIPDGKRAMTIQVDHSSGVAGSLTKGCHVDIVATVLAATATEKGMEKIPTTMVVLENVEVLLTGTYGADLSKDEKAKAGDYTSVTFAVTPEEALKLSYFITEGKLRVVLRSILDKGVSNTLPYILK